MLDFFLEASDPDEQLRESKKLDKKVAAAEAEVEAKAGDTTPADSSEVVNIMEAVKAMMNEKYVSSVGGIFVFKLKGTAALYRPPI